MKFEENPVHRVLAVFVDFRQSFLLRLPNDDRRDEAAERNRARRIATGAETCSLADLLLVASQV